MFLDKTISFFYHQKKAFSFIELCIVVISIIVLSSTASIIAKNIMDNGRYKAAQSEIATLSLAITQYHFELNEWPSDLSALTKKKNGLGPWYTGKFIDPWGEKYEYIGFSNLPIIYSLGPNKQNNSDPYGRYIGGDDIGYIFQE